MAEPTKAELLRGHIDELEQALQIAAGGKDPRVLAALQKMKDLLKPAAPQS